VWATAGDSGGQVLPYRGSGLGEFRELVQRESRYPDTRFPDLSQECGSQWRTGVVRISVSAYRESGIHEVSCIRHCKPRNPDGKLYGCGHMVSGHMDHSIVKRASQCRGASGGRVDRKV
jgi:hypothetical protein